MNYKSNLDNKLVKEQKKKMEMDVLLNGKTIKECYDENPMIYSMISKKLRKFRNDYLSFFKPPERRINIYIEDVDYCGKNFLSEYIARSLYPNMDDEKIFFIANSEKSNLSDYDGQPVIIWENFNFRNLLKLFGNRDEIFKFFNMYPREYNLGVKNTSINLVNCVNIINCNIPWKDYLDEICKKHKISRETYEAIDKGQCYKRFPILISTKDTHSEVYVNSGVINYTMDFQTFNLYTKIYEKFDKARIEIPAKYDNEFNEMSSKYCQPIIELTNKLSTVSTDSSERILDENIFNEVKYVGVCYVDDTEL